MCECVEGGEGHMAKQCLHLRFSIALPYDFHFLEEKNDQCLSFSRVYDQINTA